MVCLYLAYFGLPANVSFLWKSVKNNHFLVASFLSKKQHGSIKDRMKNVKGKG
jgi:hypothetical protein